MIKGDYDKLTEIASRDVCAEHKTPLVVAWHSGDKCWTLRCGAGGQILDELPDGAPYKSELPKITGHYPDAVTRQLSLTEMHKAGEPLPGHIEDKVIKRQRRKAMQEGNKPQDFVTALVPHVDLGTGERLTETTLMALVNYAYKYGLDPHRGHVVIMYGKPYVGLDGYLYHAQQSKKPYTLNSRPLTDIERKQYQIEDEDHAWVAEVSFADTGSTFTGLGIVTQGEMTAKSERNPVQLRSPVVASHPWQLAQKRAEWQALRRAFPIGESEKE